MLPDIHAKQGDDLGSREQGILVGSSGNAEGLCLRIKPKPPPARALPYGVGEPRRVEVPW